MFAPNSLESLSTRSSFCLMCLFLAFFINPYTSTFTLTVKSPIILERHFQDSGLANVQIIEGTNQFKFDEVLNIVTFPKNKRIGCRKYDMSKPPQPLSILCI